MTNADNKSDKNKNVSEKLYSQKKFWLKLKKFAKKAGKEVVEKALLLYYAYHEDETPDWAKRTIAGALAYFIVPFDAIIDIMPVVGYSDDLGMLALAITSVAAYINDDVREKTADKLQQWFDDDVNDKEVKL